LTKGLFLVGLEGYVRGEFCRVFFLSFIKEIVVLSILLRQKPILINGNF
jgi:hypothetical protein